MVKFECPQCKANVIKENGDTIGCPCCGYAAQGVAPYIPNKVTPLTSPYVYPWHPFQISPYIQPYPYFVGDAYPYGIWTISESSDNVSWDAVTITVPNYTTTGCVNGDV